MTKKFAVFYADTTRFLETLSRFGDGGRLEGMSLDEFQRNFTYVGTFPGATADDVFELLQDGKGGLGVDYDRETGKPIPETVTPGQLMQALLIHKIGHTSMSKGDVAVALETGKIALCASSGWDELVITGLLASAGGR